jgi:hypothetical protein
VIQLPLDTTWREPLVQTSIISAYTCLKGLPRTSGPQLGAIRVCAYLDLSGVYSLIIISRPYRHSQPRYMGYRSDGPDYFGRRVPRVFQLGREFPMSLYIVSTPTPPGSLTLKLLFRKFSTATTVGDTVQISCSTQPWEEFGRNVEEGPGRSSDRTNQINIID